MADQLRWEDLFDPIPQNDVLLKLLGPRSSRGKPRLTHTELYIYQEIVSGRKRADVAKDLGMSVANVSATYRAAKRQLQELFRPSDPGYTVEEREIDGVPVTRVDVVSTEAAQYLGKAVGSYFTLRTGDWESPDGILRWEQICTCVTTLLNQLLEPYHGKTVAIFGIGNREVMIDSLGPKTADCIPAHTLEHAGHSSPFHRAVVFTPGVKSSHNWETSKIISALCASADAACAVLIDSTETMDLNRLCRTIQINTAGASSASGRIALDQESCGVPVICIGVPTFYSLITANGFTKLTFGEIETVIQMASKIIAVAIAEAIYTDLGELTFGDILTLFDYVEHKK